MKFDNVQVKYSHPAHPSFKVEIGKVYSVAEVVDLFGLDLGMVKMCFKPIDKSWEQIESENKPKEVIKGNIEESIKEEKVSKNK